MLEGGIFITEDKKVYNIYHVRTKAGDRFDICKQEAQFHTDVSSVIYSRVKKKYLYVYGDRTLYDKYMDFIAATTTVQSTQTRTSNWDATMHAYITEDKSVNESLNYEATVKRVNGIVSERTVLMGSLYYSMKTLNDKYSILDPINIVEYEKIQLDTDTSVSAKIPYNSVNFLRAKFDLTHIDKTDSVVADTLEVAEQRLMEWSNSKEEILAVDTETTGVDIDMYGEDELVGVVLGESRTKSTYFPFRHELISNLPWSFYDKLMTEVIKNQGRVTTHNGKFERKIFKKTGNWDFRPAYDTFPLSFMINPVNHKGVHTLKTLVYQATGNRYLELSDIFKSGDGVKFQVLPKELVRLYACPDGYNSITVFYDLRDKLPVEEWPLYLKECELVSIKADNEYYGLRVDVDKYVQNAQNCDYVVDILLKTFKAITHVDGNINSPQVLGDLIYRQMHCPVLTHTKTGRPSVSGATIKKLAKTKADTPGTMTQDIKDMFGNVIIKKDALNSSKYPALVVLDKYREYNKRKTAFYNRFNRTMKTGRIFFWVNQNGAGTGRQSSPMHQLPPELKDVIISDHDDWRMVDSDYSQIELRMIAFLAGEKELIDMCCDVDNDIHRAIGSLISGIPMWKIDAATRKKGKCRNFGVVYCISEYGLAGQMFGPGYTMEQVAECKELINDFFDRFKRIKKFIKNNCEMAEREGCIETYFHRYRYFQELLDADTSSKRKAALLRQANNTPVQGTSADYLKIAECNMDRYIRNKGWNKEIDGFPMVRLALSIHDETIVMAHKSIPHEEIIKMIRDCMEINLVGAPPFFVAPAFCDTWEGHNDDSLAIPIKLRDKLIADYEATGKSVFTSKFYKLSIPSDVADYVAKARYTTPIGEIYNNIKDKIEAPDDIKEAAIKKYIKHNTKLYEDTNYLNILDAYRESVLVDYMNGLLQEYGRDYKVVAEHVRHPSLTHELIARFSKDIPKGTSHEESIEIATKLYIEGNTSDSYDDSNDIVYQQAMSEDDEKSLFAEAEALSTFDANGELVYEDTEFNEDEDQWSQWDDEDFINQVASGEIVYAWELSDSIVLDVDHMMPANVDKILEESFKYQQDGGFYRIFIYYNNILVDTGIRAEEFPLDTLSSMIKELNYA